MQGFLIGEHATHRAREVAVFVFTRGPRLIERRLPSTRPNRIAFFALRTPELDDL